PERDHGFGPRYVALLRRLVPVDRAADLRLPVQGGAVPVLIHLAPRHVPPLALRHAHAPGLEGPPAARDGKRDRDRGRAGRGPGIDMGDEKQDRTSPPLPSPASGSGKKPSVAGDVGALLVGLKTTLGEAFRPVVP